MPAPITTPKTNGLNFARRPPLTFSPVYLPSKSIIIRTSSQSIVRYLFNRRNQNHLVSECADLISPKPARNFRPHLTITSVFLSINQRNVAMVWSCNDGYVALTHLADLDSDRSAIWTTERRPSKSKSRTIWRERHRFAERHQEAARRGKGTR